MEHLLFKDLGKDILESAIISLENGVLRAQVERPFLHQRILEAAMGKADDRLTREKTKIRLGRHGRGAEETRGVIASAVRREMRGYCESESHVLGIKSTNTERIIVCCSGCGTSILNRVSHNS